MPNQQKAFRFLDLPPEIRCHIYSYLLNGKCAIKLRLGISKYRTRGRASGTIHSGRACVVADSIHQAELSPAILLANRLTYTEAISFLYSENAFIVNRPAVMPVFINTIGSSVQHLNEVGIDLPTRRSALKSLFKAAFESLKQAKNLKTLSLPQAMYIPSWAAYVVYRTADEIYQELLPLLKALSNSRRNGTRRIRLASELISLKFIPTPPLPWHDYSEAAQDIEAELKSLLDKTILA